jgi:demethylmenaquinone methyltransferase/2-methoxy-6-polyprenyl-1,4-benzoquinol methylase
VRTWVARRFNCVSNVGSCGLTRSTGSRLGALSVPGFIKIATACAAFFGVWRELPLFHPSIESMSTTHFGFQSVDEREKAQRVRGVFDSVASKYDLMNDLMSMGLHRAWKAYTVMVADVREGHQVLDIAGGTGDLALAFSKKVGSSGQVVHTDINEAMLRTGRDRLLDAGVALPTLVCDAEKLPFPDDHFDRVSVAFGLRNMTHKDVALTEMNRVLKPGGKLLVLEFSKVAKPLEKIYDWYSFKVLPTMGKLVAGDDASYRYLAESIRMHPGQQELKDMMQKSGFGHVDYHNLSGGLVALHVGIKC